MGYQAFVIRGRIEKRLRPRSGKPGDAVVAALPDGGRCYELSPESLAHELVDDFKKYVRARIPRPSQGTAAVFDYLFGIDHDVHVRGEQRATEREPRWSVQIHFSECSQSAEVSAAVTCHWAHLWHSDESERIAREHLIPFGFTPETLRPPKDTAFLPAGDLGYLQYNPKAGNGKSGQLFAFDRAAALEVGSGVRHLDPRFGEYMREARCRCQMCDPEFGDAEALPYDPAAPTKS